LKPSCWPVPPRHASWPRLSWAACATPWACADLRVQATTKAAKSSKANCPHSSNTARKTGQFYFKLVDAQGNLLLQSRAFDSPKDAGKAIGLLQQQGIAALSGLATQIDVAKDVTLEEVGTALQQLIDAAAS
jgi:tryptophanyl-tRNA synthetase